MKRPRAAFYFLSLCGFHETDRTDRQGHTFSRFCEATGLLCLYSLQLLLTQAVSWPRPPSRLGPEMPCSGHHHLLPRQKGSVWSAPLIVFKSPMTQVWEHRL